MCTTRFAVSAFGLAPNNQKQKSPARQKCEADATSKLNQSKQLVKQNFWHNVNGGALAGIVGIPVASCVLAAAVAEAAGPEATLPACGVAIMTTTTPPAILLNGTLGAGAGALFTGGQVGLAYLDYSIRMSACAKIP